MSQSVNTQKEHHRVNSFEWNWLKQMNNHT